MTAARRAARWLGLALMIAGMLLVTRQCFRDDRQRAVVGGSVESVQDRPRFAPGWGLLYLASGAGLFGWSRRSGPRTPDRSAPADPR